MSQLAHHLHARQSGCEQGKWKPAINLRFLPLPSKSAICFVDQEFMINVPLFDNSMIIIEVLTLQACTCNVVQWTAVVDRLLSPSDTDRTRAP